MKLIKDNTLDECIEGMVRHRSREAYAILGQGLWLLKAAAIHGRAVGNRGQGRKSSPTVGLDSLDEIPGFDQWLQDYIAGPESPLRISRATCYNYMRAATAMGLTADSDEEDLAQMEADKALGDRRLTDLYKPALPAGSPPPSPTPPSQPEDSWRAFRGELLDQFRPESAAMKALYRMPPQEIEAIETQIRTALDVIKEVKTEVLMHAKSNR